MPAAHPEEFRRRAVELARLREKPIAQIAKGLGSASRVCAAGWARLTSMRATRRVHLRTDDSDADTPWSPHSPGP
jgi:transposase